MKKRLFIFASYDQDGIIDESVLYYLNALSDLGDVIFHMDNESTETEIAKVRAIPNVLFAKAERHGEYDFGSYKCGYMWAADHDILKNYDWVYLANDSVYGPLRPLAPILENIESGNSDVVGMYYAINPNNVHYIQSWFVGISRNIIQEEWLTCFLKAVTSQDDKKDIIEKYEFGLTALICSNNCTFNCFMSGHEKDDLIRNPRKTLLAGLPFIKKSQFALSNLGSKWIIKRHVHGNLANMIIYNINRRKISFEKYTKIWDVRLFGFIPLISLYQEVPGGSGKKRLLLFKIIKLAKICY
ncbi:MAG: hypothetical protein LBD50_02540 [Rickettsiales bacterium]|jgi:lipopolysaccharide biosynthesis protein|nr:hypothetical protein [Rickettsiales bacterium]